MSKTKTIVIPYKNGEIDVIITLKNPYYEIKKDIIKLKYLINSFL